MLRERPKEVAKRQKKKKKRKKEKNLKKVAYAGKKKNATLPSLVSWICANEDLY